MNYNDYLIVSIEQNMYAIKNEFVTNLLELPFAYYNQNYNECDGPGIIYYGKFIKVLHASSKKYDSKENCKDCIFLLIIKTNNIEFALPIGDSFNNKTSTNNNIPVANYKLQSTILNKLVYDSGKLINVLDENKLENLYYAYTHTNTEELAI